MPAKPSTDSDDPPKDSPVSVVHPTDAAQAALHPDESTPIKTPRFSHERPSARPTLTLASDGSINAGMSRPTPTNGVYGKVLPSIPTQVQQQQPPARMNSTIRTVTSFDDRRRFSEESSTDGAPSLSASRNSGFSSSVTSNASMSSASQDQQLGRKASSGARLRPGPQGIQDGFLEVPRTASARSSVEIPQRESSLSATGTNSALHANDEQVLGVVTSMNDLSLTATEAHLSNGWDSTVGKAGLGKTGRVINRLVSDNEALKRDIQIERLRAEESKQAARLLEDKLERIVSDYESRLLEANVTKTLLARKERQVETLQSSVELERKRAVDAGERERIWKEEMEKVRAESKRKIDDATNYAALMEGRYNAISSHWRDQGDEVKKSVAKMKTEIANLLEERRKDDDRIGTLQDLCGQQDGNIRDLRQQKDDIAAQFERYKAEQEEALRGIKTLADQRERQQEQTLKEAKEVLDKLRWALNVKERVEWAQ